MNILKNQIGIFILAVFLLVATLGVSVISHLSDKVFNSTKEVYVSMGVNTSPINTFKTDVDGTLETVITGVNFIMVLIVALTIYSSFITQNTISSYLLYFIASIFLSSILIYVFHELYNNFVLSASSSAVINMDTFSNFIWVNFDDIILLNMVAFLVSFIFRKMNVGR